MKVSYDELKAEFKRVLLSRNVREDLAEECATMFADTTEYGVLSHGINRFPHFISQLEKGYVVPDAEPTKALSLGAIEQWDAHQAIGNLTAKKMMDRAMEIADQFGVGVVALKNATHWMRAGTYGWQAAEKGYIGVCWTNSMAAIPPWGSKEPRLGTNPLVIAIPSSPITMVDMSCSMYSYGALEVHRLAGRQTAVDAGYDDEGNLTRDPAIVEKNHRALPMGFWKGSGLSIVLDMIATLLSNGLSNSDITAEGKGDVSVSQVFIAIEVDRLIDGKTKDEKLNKIIEYVKTAERVDPDIAIRLPGHKYPKVKADNKANGIVVNDSVWEKLKAL
ncbi:3-dehydro-L-gulonate 2-dehydrogenase [Otariodibacter oris]|uniref:3-dehydro-L-gulonate 2-dehydrogenase n=1 Tax=Otariodibacter oris TaxID=1032623 RepID=A0A420XGR9_9PAST|nr:3-dehydro-L-gulonate 2-dehydrogenase [Otariodibacter oris]QGM80037.1 3-dehydro-L-gulonate 2-dehydrogenase [Otariodibacter oris]RKR71861.1 3-dehydro-L-gulonate 2-dehydrogenase [Otariodibacter oris]